jgi:hypothetical protein
MRGAIRLIVFIFGIEALPVGTVLIVKAAETWCPDTGIQLNPDMERTLPGARFYRQMVALPVICLIAEQIIDLLSQSVIGQISLFQFFVEGDGCVDG